MYGEFAQPYRRPGNVPVYADKAGPARARRPRGCAMGAYASSPLERIPSGRAPGVQTHSRRKC
jgi:hypothetical protein